MSYGYRYSVSISVGSLWLWVAGMSLVCSSVKGEWLEQGPRDTESKRVVPTVFLLGAMKSGTTSLSEAMLGGGSNLCQGFPLHGEPYFYDKEKHFFDTIKDADEGVSKFDEYLKHYRACEEGNILMDETPNYLCRSATAPRLLKEVYEKIGANVSALRFIVVLREPAARAISQYKHVINRVRSGQLKKTHRLDSKPWNLTCDKYFEYVLDPPKHKNISSCEPLDHGIYELHLKDWFKHFDDSQFIVLTMNQLLKDTDSVLNAVMAHAVPGGPLAHGNLPSVNSGRELKNDECTVVEELVEFYKPHVRALEKLREEHPSVFFSEKENPFTFSKIENSMLLDTRS